MSDCPRGCCWSPYGCAKGRECECHWGDWLRTAAAQNNNGAVTTYRDPTSAEAIRNIERKTRGK